MIRRPGASNMIAWLTLAVWGLVFSAETGLVHAQTPCATGFYRASGVCTPCTNKNVADPAVAVYDPSTVTLTANVCPWSCIAGYAKITIPGLTYCQRCLDSAGFFSPAGSTACSACTNKPANAFYLLPSANGFNGSANDCPWACNAGYEKQFEESCEACQPGYYKEPEALVDESSVQQSCKKCSGSCGVGKYLAKACLGWQNSVCETCRTRCNPGQYITAQCSWNADTQCAACATTCPVNTRISQVTCTGTTSNDVVLANCIPCLVLGDCPDGTYLTSKCTGETMMLNICGICSTYTCEAGSYITGCKGYDNSFCKPYTQCKPGEFLNLWGSFNDGVCEKCLDCSIYGVPVAKACSAFQNTVCGGDACSESKPCASTTNSVRYCEYVLNPGSPVCGLCPAGYQSDGQFCLECPEGRTCTRRGAVQCEGQCAPGVRSICDNALGYVQCEEQMCDMNSVVGLEGGMTTVTRGTYDSPASTSTEACMAYIRCKVGSYKRFLPSGRVECAPCNGRPLLESRYVSNGLSPNDASSCLWEYVPDNKFGSRVPVHQAGWYGSQVTPGTRFAPRTCPSNLYTTEENTTVLVTGCLHCPSIPADAVMLGGTRNCEWTCVGERMIRRGARCVELRVPVMISTECDGVGMRLDAAGICVTSSLPWNRAGYRKVEPLVRAVSTSGRTTAGRLALASSIKAYSNPGGVSGRHRVEYAGAGAGVIVSVQVEGPICSMTKVWIGEQMYLVGAVCNQSFLVYYAQQSSSGSSQQRLRLLIGQAGNPGWADGFKTQARFGTELYVTSGTQDGLLWVLDRWNCVVREVSMWSQPGDYRTRVYTVHGITDKLIMVPPEPKCYGAGSLSGPRKFWEIGGGRDERLVLFTDDDGLWQLEVGSGELSRVMLEETLDFEADDLVYVLATSDRFSLMLGFADGTEWTVEASVEACPDDFTSKEGGDCVMWCIWDNGVYYVNRSSGECVACVAMMSCGVGEEFVPCTRNEQARCRECPEDEARDDNGKVFVTPGSCDPDAMKYTVPCPIGFYASSQMPGYCDTCPGNGLATTVLTGATRVQQCKCLKGLRRHSGICIGEALYEYDTPGACVSSVKLCSLPANASLVDGGGWGRCMWECDAGFYREDLTQCSPCLRVGDEAERIAASRGDDDEPMSCEFFPLVDDGA